MHKKVFPALIILSILILLFTGCNEEDNGTNTYISLMSVPTEATIPNGLRLDSILSITNTNPETPEGPPTTVQIGVFGFTNKNGVVEYYVYGKKQGVVAEQIHLIEEGFYAVNYSKENELVGLSLKDTGSPIRKTDLGTGTPTSYDGPLPLAFYTPTEQIGVYNFADAEGNTMLRVYATFLGKNGNFFPADDSGNMIAGSLPVDTRIEEMLLNEGSDAASRILTTPIDCTNIQVDYPVN